MPPVIASAPETDAPPSRTSPRFALTRAAGLTLLAAALLFMALVSIAVGAKGIPLGEVAEVLFHDDGSEQAAIVRELRLPRTLVGIAVGCALGLAGALMQSITRNPLADPGLLGVDAGAAAAVVLAISLLDVRGIESYMWFAFAGAAVASLAVYALGSTGRGGATPVRLALAGTAVLAALTALIEGVTLLDPKAFDQYRFWSVGSLAGRDLDVLLPVLPFLAIGALIALALARPLNAVALGDDAGRALGAHIGRTRVLTAVAIILLCGGATAVAGPIAFVGLAIPHAVRAVTGPDLRWVLPYSLVAGAVLLLSADVLGRIVVRPGELQVGIVTALLGAPIFIALVRRRRIAQL
ncbi:MAG TPA: iron chelate uptake ABC transporter family permease subunit [Solirubrobacterales bacterium]|nr:iron chelate uptake ABC transporter family permease subunit [Solirubrobacterales bacterium]